MTNDLIDERFEELHEALSRIKDLDAWSDLKRGEATPYAPPAFQLTDPTPTERRDQIDYFWALARDLYDLLEDRRKTLLSVSQRQTYQQQLFKLETQLRRLTKTETFIKF